MSSLECYCSLPWFGTPRRCVPVDANVGCAVRDAPYCFRCQNFPSRTLQVHREGGQRTEDRRCGRGCQHAPSGPFISTPNQCSQSSSNQSVPQSNVCRITIRFHSISKTSIEGRRHNTSEQEGNGWRGRRSSSCQRHCDRA